MARDDFVDDVEEDASDGLGSGLIIVTTLVLFAAFIIVQMALKEYGVGMMK